MSHLLAGAIDEPIVRLMDNFKISLRRLMRAIARTRIGTRMEPTMRVIDRTRESDI